MKKGKTLTALVLVLEIASITVLHAVKINHKSAGKELSKNSNSEQPEPRSKSTYSLAVFK